MSNAEKISRIREKGGATSAKRKYQTAKVYEIKFDKAKSQNKDLMDFKAIGIHSACESKHCL
ncbi:MAG: hypothetical protein QXN59_01575 [Candidatus Micrarchaeaceae archaeon]